MKEFPYLHHSRRETDLDHHPIPGVNAQSLHLDLAPQSGRMIEEVDLNLQEEMIGANINHNQGAFHALGPRDLHHI